MPGDLMAGIAARFPGQAIPVWVQPCNGTNFLSIFFFQGRQLIVVVKKTFRYLNGFFYYHLYQPECFYEKRYKIRATGQI
jgi:hypothetical protein